MSLRTLFSAGSLLLAAAAFGLDRQAPQINIEVRLVSMVNDTLRDSGFDTGWGAAVEALWRRDRPEDPSLTLGLSYDHMKCEQDFLKIETIGLHVGFLGQFDRRKSADESQLLWRAAVGIFQTKTEGLGNRDETGLGFDLGVQFGRPSGRGPSFGVMFSHRPEAFGVENHRIVGLISIPISTPN